MMSGDAGGGTVRIGGDFHGQGATPTAQATVVQQGATINANAITTGNGGNVTVWADDYTDYEGFIEARGGSQSGNGGFVETSGKLNLDMSGLVDASAAFGNPGIWLMDPNNLTVNGSTTTNAGSSPSWTAGGGGGNVLNTDINTALNGGTAVTLTATGVIEISANISKTSGTTTSLTLSAGQDITMDTNTSITSTSNALNVTFDADTAGSGGAIVMNTGSHTTTNNGSVTFGGNEATPSNIVAGTGYAIGDATYAAGININGATVNAGSGTVIMNGQGYGSAPMPMASKCRLQGWLKAPAVTVYGQGGGGGGNGGDYGVYVTGSSSTIETTGAGGAHGLRHRRRCQRQWQQQRRHLCHWERQPSGHQHRNNYYQWHWRRRWRQCF